MRQVGSLGDELPEDRLQSQMRILVDVSLSESVVDFLNSLGHHAVWSGALMPATSPDTDIVARAIADRRVILTRDLDFSRIIERLGERGPSLITLRMGRWPLEAIMQSLSEHLPSVEGLELQGRMATIDDTGLRVHMPRA